MVSLNLRDNDKIKGSPHKELSTSPSRPIEKALNKISTESSISSSANDSYVEGGSSLKAKDLNVIINERQQAKIENNSKLLLNAVGDKNKIECDAPGVKFPSLADSIDTTKARMLFEQGKNLKPKKVDCTLRKNKIRDTITQNNAKLNYNSVQKREIKRDINVSSGIPLPTFGSTRKYYTNISRKTEKEKKLESTPSLSRRKAENSIQNSKLISKSTNNKFDSAHEKEIIEMAVLKKEMIGRLQKNAGISVEDFKYCLEKNIEKVNKNYEKASEKSNKFSESMLASIRENEYPPISMHNGLNNESKGLK